MDAAKLKKIRLKIGLSQVELARRLDTPRNTYVQWERGVRRIPGILKIALKAVEIEIEGESAKQSNSEGENLAEKEGGK